MTLLTFLNKLDRLRVSHEIPADIEVVAHELIGGFMEDVEDIAVTVDPISDERVIAIQFRNA